MATTAVREKPILFSSDMVRAIIDGRKTMTRRIMKPQPTLPHYTRLEHHEGDVGAIFSCDGVRDGETVEQFYCPYGGPGMRLWVRETWSIHDQDGGGDAYGICYAADGDEGAAHWPTVPDSERGKYTVDERNRPSIHMPRWASRLTLEIAEVRCEPVHDIGSDGRKAKDVLAEGITPEQIEHERKWFHPDDSPAIAFSRLWESVNGKGAWGRNEWVWCITFRKTE